jgi:hypothetical protein
MFKIKDLIYFYYYFLKFSTFFLKKKVSVEFAKVLWFFQLAYKERHFSCQGHLQG